MQLTLEESPLKDDEMFEAGNMKFLIHAKDKVYFNGRKIDFVKNVLGNGYFKVI